MNIPGILAMLIPIMIFAIPIVAIVLNHKAEMASKTGFSEEDAEQLDELMDAADTMAERIKTLESILDVETPEWRDRHDEA